MKSTILLVSLTLLTSCTSSREMLRITECSPANLPAKNLLQIKDGTSRSKTLIAESFSKATSLDHEDRINVSPDSKYIRIDIFHETKNGLQQVILESMHPILEGNPNIVVTSQGVESLDGRDREEVLQADKSDYQTFRRVFDSIRSEAQDLAEQGAEANR